MYLPSENSEFCFPLGLRKTKFPSSVGGIYWVYFIRFIVVGWKRLIYQKKHYPHSIKYLKGANKGIDSE